jgi:hypothetical protein
MEAEKCLWLDKKERILPSPNHPSQEHQEEPVGLPVNWSFDLSMKDDQLVYGLRTSSPRCSRDIVV